MAYENSSMKSNADSDDNRTLVNLIGSQIDDSLGFIQTETAMSVKQLWSITYVSRMVTK